MKLILTSIGLANETIKNQLLILLNMKPEEARLLMIAYGNTDQAKQFIEDARTSVAETGIAVTVLNMSQSFNCADLGDSNAIFVCGGNTFTILNKMRETRIDEYIKEQFSQGAVYNGVSAGSIIAGPDIQVAGWGAGQTHIKQSNVLL